ncbi:hypothetical protein GGR57DRAFT_152864 [Xylariaceae sp. FL1272]|nr:hypothetical protein GGR57DRAFT_152864 [Xylariaceae sp. FL1272]
MEQYRQTPQIDYPSQVEYSPQVDYTKPVYMSEADRANHLQAVIAGRLGTLIELQRAQAREPIVYETLYNVLLQVVGLLVAALFGAFSILAWQIAGAANDLAAAGNELGSAGNDMAAEANCAAASANFLSIFDFCSSADGRAFDGICDVLAGTEARNAFDSVASAAVSAVSTCLSTPTASSTGAAPTGGSDGSEADSGLTTGELAGTIIGGVVGGLVLILFLALRYLSYRAKKTMVGRAPDKSIPGAE